MAFVIFFRCQKKISLDPWNSLFHYTTLLTLHTDLEGNAASDPTPIMKGETAATIQKVERRDVMRGGKED